MQIEQIRPDEKFDLIIVGAGLSGSILAARIAQFGVNPKNGEKLKIAMFDAGPYFKGDPMRGYGHPSRRSAFDNVPYEDSRYTLPWGDLGMVGGSAIHAGMISYPPQPIDLIHYREATGVDWTWEKFSAPLQEMWEMWHPYPEPEELRTPGQERFRRAALDLGYDVLEAGQAKLNCPRCGCCNGHLCKYDAKSSGLVTYIPIAEREGVRIIPKTMVEKVLMEKKGSRPLATGVVYRSNGETRRALADKIILSCSMDGTPRLLYASGYGPREKVQGELFAENRNVGANRSGTLSAPTINVWFGEPIKTDIGVHCVYYALRSLGPGGYNQLLIRETLGCLEGTTNYPDEIALSPVAPEFGRDHKAYMKKARSHRGHLSVDLNKNLVRPKIGEDQVALTRQSLEKNHPEVIEGLRAGQEMAYKILQTMGAKKILGHDRLPERFSFGFATSTCRAGASPENSVVNSDFECHDIDNLFICDRSVPPCQATANVSMPLAAMCNYAWRRLVVKHFSRA